MKTGFKRIDLKPKPRQKALVGPIAPADVEAKAELSETLRSFRARNDVEAKRFNEATDSEFWCALCFETRAQKEEFLQKAGLIAYGDKYLDGRLIARQMGIVLDNKGSLPPLAIRRDKDYMALSSPREGGDVK